MRRSSERCHWRRSARASTTSLVWPKQRGAPKLLQDLVDQLALPLQAARPLISHWRMRRRVGRRRYMTRRVPLWLGAASHRRTGVVPGVPSAYLVALAQTDSSLAHPLREFMVRTASRPRWPLLRSPVVVAVHRVRRGGDRRHHGLGLGLALLLRARNPIGVVGALLLLPLVRRSVLIGVAWKLLLAPVGGGLADVSPRWDWRVQSAGVRVGASRCVRHHIWQWTPLPALYLFAALASFVPSFSSRRASTAQVRGATSPR